MELNGDLSKPHRNGGSGYRTEIRGIEAMKGKDKDQKASKEITAVSHEINTLTVSYPAQAMKTIK